MEPEFWRDRWAANLIGFNQPHVNPYLIQLWPELSVKPGERVFVPLCGKSIDMGWLGAQGFHVVGVELSEKAVEDYFAENGIQPNIQQRGDFKVYSHGAGEIWCGDFFALTAEDIGNCTAVYDRAALIAMPADLRWRYVQHLNRLLAEDARGLLITLDYDQSEMAGPPFAVDEDEVQQLLSLEWRVKMVGDWDILAQSSKFQQAGVTHLKECAFRMFRR